MNINKVEIWKVGKTIDGRTITKKDVETAFQNTNGLIKEGYTIPLRSGHDDNTQEAKGWVTNLRLENNSIYADFENVDNEIYNKIATGRLPHRSIEIWSNFTWKDKQFKNTIKAVALLGSDTPAFFLEPIQAYENNEPYDVFLMENAKNKTMEFTMDFEKKYNELKVEYETYKAREVNELSEKFDAVQKQVEKYQAEINEHVKQKEELEARVKEFQAKEFETQKQSIIDSFKSKVLEKGKLTPADAKGVYETFEALEYDKEKCEKLIKTFESLPESDLTQEYGAEHTPEQTEREDELEKKFASQLGVK